MYSESCSIVIPAKNETVQLNDLLTKILEQKNYDFECFIVVDSIDDQSCKVVRFFQSLDNRFCLLVNKNPSNPATAIRFGISKATKEKIIIIMGDGSDDPGDIPKLLNLLGKGVSVACASRYTEGGAQLNAKFIKSSISRIVGLSFQLLTKVGTHDITNSYKGYSKEFLDLVGIESAHGFELGIEMVAKAYRYNKIVAQIPTIWIEKNIKQSNFKIIKWAPIYLKWYLYGLKRN